jgi:hypothetical protein
VDPSVVIITFTFFDYIIDDIFSLDIYHLKYNVQDFLKLLSQGVSLVYFRIVLELDLSDAAKHLKELDELKDLVLSHLVLLEDYTHLAHAEAKDGVLFDQLQTRIFHHEVEAILHGHVVLSRFLIEVVHLLAAFKVDLKDIVDLNSPELLITPFLPRLRVGKGDDMFFQKLVY